MSMIERLQSMLDAGTDNAMLRFTLGSEHLKAGDAASAATHLRAAVEHDPGYSAAWKLLGRALAGQGLDAEALEAFESGIRVAEERGDKQASREMQVFAKRARKRLEH